LGEGKNEIYEKIGRFIFLFNFNNQQKYFMKRIALLSLLLTIPFLSFSQDVFDIGIRKIEIFFSEPNWNDTLNYNYANDLGRLLADSILIDGKMDDSVGVKYKGNSSYSVNNAKNPLSIKLDWKKPGQSIDGYNILKLSNGFRDPSFIREVLSYEIARNYMPASKATYANVFINGAWNGLYTCVQSVDFDFLNENFYERKGPFFKADNVNIQVTGCPPGPLGIWKYWPDSACYQEAFEMQSTNDWTQLQNFTDTLNNSFSFVENVLDIDRTLWMMAFNNLTVTLDGPVNNIPHNYYMFKDNNARFSPILWDMNGSFGTFTMGLPQPVTNQSLQELDVFHGSANSQNKMTLQMFSSAQFKRMYIAHMRTMLNEQFVNSNYLQRSIQLQSIIDSSVNADTKGFYSYNSFIANTTSSVGNPNSIIGITELMDNRVTYLLGLNEFTAIPPSIVNLSSSPVAVLPHSTINITAEISNSTYAYLGYRFKFSEKFEKLQMFDDGNHGDGVSGDGIFGSTLNVDARDIQYYIYAENIDAGIFSPERAEKEFHQLAIVSDLVINEIMAANTITVADQDGEYDDWVELYNRSNSAINLNGYYLSDDENLLTKWTFPNISIQANDYLIIWCDTAGNSQAGLHSNFKFASDQEEVYLTDPNGIVVDAVHFVNMPADISYARIPNGTGTFIHQNETFNLTNQFIAGISNMQHKKSLQVYPNPSNKLIYLSGTKSEIKIYNVMGQLIYTGNNTHSIDISAWGRGIYILKSEGKTIKIAKN